MHLFPISKVFKPYNHRKGNLKILSSPEKLFRKKYVFICLLSFYLHQIFLQKMFNLNYFIQFLSTSIVVLFKSFQFISYIDITNEI